jgi:hypothetical protein
MIVALIALVSLLIGFLCGFFAQALYSRVTYIYTSYKEERYLQDAGVVTPERRRVQTRQPIDLSADQEGGVIMRPDPDKIIAENLKEQNRKISGQSS